MEFRPINRFRPGDNQVSVAVTKQGVSITIPSRVAQASGLQGAAQVKLGYGEAGRKRCVQITADAAGAFKIASRKNVHVVIAKELEPKAASSFTDKKIVVHEASSNGLVITLPESWELARRDLVVGA